MPCLSHARVQNSHYFSWLKEESGVRLVALMVPLWGAAIVGRYDYVAKNEAIMDMGSRYRDFTALAPWLKNNMDVIKAACAALPDRIQYVDDDVALRYMRDMMQNDPQKFNAASPHLKEEVRCALFSDRRVVLSGLIHRAPQLIQSLPNEVALSFMRTRLEHNLGDFLLVEAYLAEEVKRTLVNEAVLRHSFDGRPEIIKYATNELARSFMQQKIVVNPNAFWTAENHLSEEVKRELITERLLLRNFNDKPEIMKYATDEMAITVINRKMQVNADDIWLVASHLNDEVKAQFKLNDLEYAKEVIQEKPERLQYFTKEVALVLIKEDHKRFKYLSPALLQDAEILQELTKEKLAQESIRTWNDYRTGEAAGVSVTMRLERVRHNPISVLNELADVLVDDSYPIEFDIKFLDLHGDEMDGSDAGGLSRAFFSEMGEAMKSLLSPKKNPVIVGYKKIMVWKNQENGTLLQVEQEVPMTQIVEERVKIEDKAYKALGYLMGVAFLEKKPVGCLFSPAVYDLLVAIRTDREIFQAYEKLWKADNNGLDSPEKEKMRLVNLSFEVIDLLKNPIEKPNLEEVDFDDDLPDQVNDYFDQIEKFASFLYSRIKNNKPDWWGEDAVPDIEMLIEHGDWITNEVKELNLDRNIIENDIVEEVKKSQFSLIATGLFDPKILVSETLRNANAEDLRLKVEGSQVSVQGMKDLFSIPGNTIKGWMHRWFDEYAENTEMLKLFLWAATGSKSIINFGETPKCSDYESNAYFKFATCSLACYVNKTAINNNPGKDKYLLFKEQLEKDLSELKVKGFTAL